MATPRQVQTLPTATELTTFLQSFFPSKANDVPFIYHRPFSRSFDASSFRISSIVLSVTPTQGFYASLHYGTKLGFLHRPFGLDRRNVPRLVTVLSSHKAFDEVLTVGANTALGVCLGLDSSRSVIIQGYKGDPERRIGLVAPFRDDALEAEAAKSRILLEFKNQIEGAYGFEEDATAPVKAVAIMKAFHPEEVDRAIETAQSLGLLATSEGSESMLYLTGAVREPGLEYARIRGIKVICVGHRMCEEWGIGYLAIRLRERFPGLRVGEVYEEEEPREKLDSQKIATVASHFKADGRQPTSEHERPSSLQR